MRYNGRSCGAEPYRADIMQHFAMHAQLRNTTVEPARDTATCRRTYLNSYVTCGAVCLVRQAGEIRCRVPLQRIVDGLLDLLAKAAAPVLHMLQKTLTSTQAFDPKPRCRPHSAARVPPISLHIRETVFDAHARVPQGTVPSRRRCTAAALRPVRVRSSPGVCVHFRLCGRCARLRRAAAAAMATAAAAAAARRGWRWEMV
jgi:hypothetical protein